MELIHEKEMIDARLSEAMAAIREGANSFPGLNRLSWRQHELEEQLAQVTNA